MKKVKLAVPVLGVMLFLGAGPALAASQAVKDMAVIVLDLSHRPDSAGKERLKNIANDSSATVGERTLASSLLHMDHQVSDADKAKLRDLRSNSAAPAEERELAVILIDLAHKPSGADKAKLKDLAK